jgi:predicted DNA repair protein MutK
MSGGLAALLDDIAAIAKLAAASIDDVGAAAGRASVKAAGVVVDDTAVTPRYVQGFTPDRELPIIKRITIGSIRNKLVFILPAIMLLSQFLPWALTPAAHGRRHLSVASRAPRRSGRRSAATTAGCTETAPAIVRRSDRAGEDDGRRSAIRTDFILSAEIMVIALNEVATEPLASRDCIILIVVAVVHHRRWSTASSPSSSRWTTSVWHLSRARSPAQRAPIGRAPRCRHAEGADGWLAIGRDRRDVVGRWPHPARRSRHPRLARPYALVHHAEEAVAAAVSVGSGALAWLTNTLGSAIAGLIVGAVVVLIMHLIPRKKDAANAAH